jgi:hypothetical protein
MSFTSAELVAGLRACADWFEKNPGVELPFGPKLQILSVHTKADVAALARQMGKCEKTFTDTIFKVIKHFGPGFSVEGLAYREQVCERIVVGQETVEVPAVEAKAARIEVREIVEWKCGSLMTTVELPKQAEIPAPKPLLIEGEFEADFQEIPF